MTRFLALLLVSSFLPGCGGNGAVPLDAATIDAAPGDSGPADAGPRADRALTLSDAGACESWATGDPGEPIEGLVPGEWTWIDVPEAHCMNGSSTGFGISLAPEGSRRVVLYLEGGGACFETLTCATVAGRNGISRADFEASSARLDDYALFSRNDSMNPMRDWTFVYIPYCTGDIHVGTNPEGYQGREQVGYLNLGHDLRRIVPTLADAELVLLTGASAGGLGAMVNYDRVQSAFGCTPVHLINDGAPVLDDLYLRPCLQNLARTLWQPPFPADCPQCALEDGSGFVELWDYLAVKYPNRRFAQLATMADITMRSFFGFGYSENCSTPDTMSVELYTEALNQLRGYVLADHPNVRTFYMEGLNHTMLPIDLTMTTSDGHMLATWITEMIEDDPAWSHAGP